MSFVYMVALQVTPERYERGMAFLTLGRLSALRAFICRQVVAGERVLEIGCGTGALAARLAMSGAAVVGIDISPGMLKVARELAESRNVTDRVTLREQSVMELDRSCPDASFDLIVSVLTFSELLEEEIDFALNQCRRLLEPGGRLIIADEVMPDSPPLAFVVRLARFPFAAAARLIAGTGTRPLRRLPDRLRRAGFETMETRSFLAGTLQVCVAKRCGNAEEARCA